jgi:prophage regulatory protein
MEQHDALINQAQVEEIVGFKKSTLWVKVKGGQFPQPVRISPGCTRWSRLEVLTWVEDRKAERQIAA